MGHMQTHLSNNATRTEVAFLHITCMTQATALCWQVTEGTVDEGVYGLTKQKLKLDAAVLQGITAGSQASVSTKDVAQMGQLLQALVSGCNDDVQ